MEVLESRAYLAAISFQSHVDVSEGTSPVAIVAGNFDAGTTLDLAVADGFTNKVNIFLNTGTGTFNAGPQLSMTVPPVAMVAGDFDGNGTTDIAVAGAPGSGIQSTTVTVFLNNGNGTFAAGLITTVLTNQASGEPIGLVAGNFNGDTHLDLATTDFDAGEVSVLLGGGNGGFASPVTYTVGTHPTSLVSADFSGDGTADLAVADFDTNPNTSGQEQVITFLNGIGDGTFTRTTETSLGTTGQGTLTTADLDGDGIPDIVDANTDDHAYILLNDGNDQIFLASTLSTSGPAGAVAVSDFNFDGQKDVVAADGGNPLLAGRNFVTVGSGIAGGGFSTTNDFATGVSPLGIAVGDFNGDRKPDIATANNGDGTFSILLNNTPGTVIQATTTTLVASTTSVPFQTNVQFTATVTGPNGAGLPTGTVNFFDASVLIGSAAIGAGTNQAVFNTTALGVGDHTIIARYVSDGTFGVSSSAVVHETITPTAGNGPDLVGTFVSTTLPTIFVPGELATVRFKITNAGNFAGKGTITNQLFLSLDDTIDSNDIQVTVRGPLAKFPVNLGPGKFITLIGVFTVPAGMTVSDLTNYVLLANINASGSLLESDASNNVSTPSPTLMARYAFGNVGGRANVALTLPDADGTNVTYRLVGPGDGVVSLSDNGIEVVLFNTTAKSSFFISGRGGDGIVEISGISDNDPFGAAIAPKTNLNGVQFFSGVRQLVLNDVSNAIMSIATTQIVNDPPGSIPPSVAPAIIVLHNASNVAIDCELGIGTLIVSGWTADPPSQPTSFKFRSWKYCRAEHWHPDLQGQLRRKHEIVRCWYGFKNGNYPRITFFDELANDG